MLIEYLYKEKKIKGGRKYTINIRKCIYLKLQGPKSYYRVYVMEFRTLTLGKRLHITFKWLLTLYNITLCNFT